MKLAQFKTKDSDRQRLGMLIGDGLVCDVAELARAVKNAGIAVADWLLRANSMIEVIRFGDDAVKDLGSSLSADEAGSGQAQTVAYSINSIEFLPAVYPSKILAIGRNYAEHAAEGGADLPKAPLLFNQLTNALSAHQKPIALSPISKQIDYEAELAVIIGRTAKRVSESE